jgi:anti-sigma factor RsiW
VNCKETQDLIHGYLDGELDLINSLETEKHLKNCPACSQNYASQQELRRTLSNSDLYFRAPPETVALLRAAVFGDGKSKIIKMPGQPENRLVLLRVFMPLAAAAMVLVLSIPFIFANNDRMVREVASAHIRSLMADHLNDVASSDQHTVKPWFVGRLDFSPTVVDLTAQGFALVGGRLDYVNGRTVAAMVYQRRKHFINLFVWPANRNTETHQQSLTRQGFNIIHWERGGFNYWAVSDMNKAELSSFSELVRNAGLPAN